MQMPPPSGNATQSPETHSGSRAPMLKQNPPIADWVAHKLELFPPSGLTNDPQNSPVWQGLLVQSCPCPTGCGGGVQKVGPPSGPEVQLAVPEQRSRST